MFRLKLLSYLNNPNHIHNVNYSYGAQSLKTRVWSRDLHDGSPWALMPADEPPRPGNRSGSCCWRPCEEEAEERLKIICRICSIPVVSCCSPALESGGRWPLVLAAPQRSSQLSPASSSQGLQHQLLLLLPGLGGSWVLTGDRHSVCGSSWGTAREKRFCLQMRIYTEKRARSGLLSSLTEPNRWQIGENLLCLWLRNWIKWMYVFVWKSLLCAAWNGEQQHFICHKKVPCQGDDKWAE